MDDWVDHLFMAAGCIAIVIALTFASFLIYTLIWDPSFWNTTTVCSGTTHQVAKCVQQFGGN